MRKRRPAAQLTPAAQQRLDTLFDSHADRLYRLARRLAPNADDALDLVQDTFLKVTQAWTEVPTGHAAEEAWLVRILVNIRRDQWRQEAVRRRNLPQLRRAATVQPDPGDLYALQVDIWQALDTLPPRRRHHEYHRSMALGVRPPCTRATHPSQDRSCE